MLIEAGCNLDQQEKYGRTALAVCLTTNKKSVAKLLLSKGAAVDIVDGYGRTCLQLATKLKSHSNLVT